MTTAVAKAVVGSAAVVEIGVLKAFVMPGQLEEYKYTLYC